VLVSKRPLGVTSRPFSPWIQFEETIETHPEALGIDWIAEVKILHEILK